MTLHLSDRVAVTGAGGGIGSAVLSLLRANPTKLGTGDPVPPIIRELHRSDDLTEADGALGLVLCHAAPVGASLEEQFEIDVLKARAAIDARVPAMFEAGRGVIVLFSSIRAHHPRRGQADYATVKAAIEGLTRGLAVEWARSGVTVNCIAPGAVDTPRTRANIARGVVTEAELVGPSGKMATADDVARVVAWMLYAAPSTFTGQVVTVDAGWSVEG